MAAKSYYLANAIGNLVCRNVSYTPPATVYLALFDGTSSTGNLQAGTLTGEISTTGTAYARQAVSFAAFASGVAGNSVAVTFPTATANWGNVTYAALMDSATALTGNVLYYAPLSSVQTINNGNQLALNPGVLSVTES